MSETVALEVLQGVEPSLWQTVVSSFKRFFEKDDPKDSHLYKHAVRELKSAGYFNDDPEDDLGNSMNKMMRDNVLDLIVTFAKQGHSGFSAPYCVKLFSELASYKPLLPLQGTDDEWVDVSAYGGREGGKVWQNLRCSHVFKEDDGKGAYDIDAVLYREPDGCCYTKGGARHYITFPYTPTREYIDVPFDHDDPRAETEPQLSFNFT